LGKRHDEYRHAALFWYLYNLTNLAGIRETVGEASYPWKHGSLTLRTCGRISRNDYVQQMGVGYSYISRKTVKCLLRFELLTPSD
jgi:hypothetical protein